MPYEPEYVRLDNKDAEDALMRNLRAIADELRQTAREPDVRPVVYADFNAEPDRVYRVDTTSNDVRAQFPRARSYANRVVTLRKESASNTLFFDVHPDDTLEGTASQTAVGTYRFKSDALTKTWVAV